MRLNGIKTTDEILELGIEKFNEACRASVMKYTGEWRDYVTRQARWVDFDNDYRTFEPRLHGVGDLGLQAALRQGPGLRGLPGAALLLERRDPAVQPRAADGRRRLPDARRTRPSPSGYGSPADRPRARWLLVWTTTPWTLPSNLAVMVGADIDYVVVESTSRDARALPARRGPAGGVRRELGDEPGGRLARLTGADLLGLHLHAAVLLLRSATSSAFRVVPAEFVTTTDGTGLVHTAGAFGEDDKVVTDREGIEAVMPVGKDGRFTAPGRRLRRHAGLRRQPARSSTTSRRRRRDGRDRRRSRPARCCCAARPTTTATRTAGAAASR